MTAAGSRADDGTVITGGQTNQVEITVSDLSTGTAYDLLEAMYDILNLGDDAVKITDVADIDRRPGE